MNQLNLPEFSVLTIYYDRNSNTFEDDFNSNIDVYKLMSKKGIVKYKQIGGTYYTNKSGIVYEIEFPIDDLNKTLSYDSNLNMIFDEYGHIVYNIFHFVSPIMLSIFKQRKEKMIVNGKNGGFVELIYDE